MACRKHWSRRACFPRELVSGSIVLVYLIQEMNDESKAVQIGGDDGGCYGGNWRFSGWECRFDWFDQYKDLHNGCLGDSVGWVQHC